MEIEPKAIEIIREALKPEEADIIMRISNYDEMHCEDIMSILTYDEVHFEFSEDIPSLDYIIECTPHFIYSAVMLWSYVIDHAIRNTKIKITKSFLKDRYNVIFDGQTHIKYSIIFEYLDKNEVFNKLSDEYQCWLMLNDLM